MVGPGAGIAPMRALLQEKYFLENCSQNDSFGRVSLYFGCRNSKIDYIYKEELELLEDKNVINKLRVAFSREGKEKVYV